VQFLNDIPGAIDAMRKAVKEAPDQPRFSKALEELEKLSESLN